MTAAYRFERFQDVPASVWRWPNFAPGEVASARSTYVAPLGRIVHGDGSIVVVPVALDCLQRLRDLVGGPVRLNSAYRDPLYNARIGGAPASQHKAGTAFDVAIGNYDRGWLAGRARAAGFTGFGYYRTFLHVDCGRPRFWYGKGAKQLWKP